MGLRHAAAMDARTPEFLPTSGSAVAPNAPLEVRRLAPSAARAVAGGNVRLGADREAGAVLAQAAGVPRPGLSGRGRLHGSRQLGDLARRRLQIWLRAADGGVAVQPDGDRAAIAVHAARRRRGPRSRAGLPGFLSALGLVAAVAVGGDRHHRDRSRRGDRHRDRAQSVVSHSARARRHHHRRRRVSDPCAAGVRLSLDRGLRGGDAGCDRRLLCRADRDGRSGLGRGAQGLCADHGDSAQPRNAVSGARHPRRHRDAA